MINHSSKTSRLPAEIRDKIAAMRNEGSSIDEILAYLRGLDLPQEALPTRAGLGRYTKRLDRETDEATRARAIVGALTDKLGKLPKSRRAQLNIELLQILVTGIAAAAVTEGEDGKVVTLAPAQIYTLAKALESLLRSQRTELDATLLRKEEAARSATPPAEQQGLSAERVHFLQTRIAGLRMPPPDDGYQKTDERTPPPIPPDT